MNFKALLFIILTIISQDSFADQAEEKAGPDYQIISSEKDKNLKVTESMFEFICKDDSGTILPNYTVQFSTNELVLTAISDKEGKFSRTVKPGKYLFQVFIYSDYHEIYTDSILIKPGYKTKIQLNFRHANIQVISDKPVIYLYPKVKTEVSVQLSNSESFTFTYPEYKNGWSVVADPDGTIDQEGKKYNYLFWEGKTNLLASSINWQTGFLVEKEHLLSFLESNLTAMGLNSFEQQDFITYWIPRMQVNELNYIHFLFNEEYDKYAGLTISPKPDQLFRVYMIWSDATKRTDLNPEPQKIPSFKREGFTVLEWGGAELRNLNHIN